MSVDPNADSPFCLLPNEIIRMICKEYFKGITLIPWFREAAEVGNDALFAKSRLALLVLCKSQHAQVKEIFWQCAKISFQHTNHLSTVLIRNQSVTLVRYIHMSADVTSMASYLNVRSVLGKMLHLEIVEMSFQEGASLDFKHNEFLTEAMDPTSQLVNCIGLIISENPGTYLTWIGRILDPAFTRGRELDDLPWRHPLKIIINFTLENKDIGLLDNASSTNSPLEEFSVPVRFASDTYAITGTHLNQNFSVPQKPLGLLFDSTNLPNIHAFEESNPSLVKNLILGATEFWSLYQEFFSDIAPNPRSLTELFLLAEYFADLIDDPEQASRCLERAWSLGRELLLKRVNFDITQKPNGGYALDRETQWCLWRRLLKVESEDLLARPWRTAHDLISQSLDHIKRDLLSLARDNGHDLPDDSIAFPMGFAQQKHFFTKLFSHSEPWMTH